MGDEGGLIEAQKGGTAVRFAQTAIAPTETKDTSFVCIAAL